jgi:ferredoxin/protein involved in ribonucleotide reduction
MITFYFTATGNSLAVAKKLGGALISIPQAIKSERYEYTDDVIGFVFPTYCCNVPRIVREFISKAKLKADYLFAVATYGNSMGSGGDGNEMLEFAKFAKQYGYSFNYLNAILMVDNFVDAFDIEKEIEKIPSKKINEHLETIIFAVKDRKNFVKTPSMFGKMITGFCRGLVKTQDKGLTSQKFIVNDACIQCGTCVKVCPRGNISLEDKPVFGNNCEGCYACLHICPNNAICIKNEKSVKRWKNPDVSVKEIIASNNQK